MAENIDNIYAQRILPHDYDAEQAVLSCMLYDSDGIVTAYEALTGDDFYGTNNKIIFEAIVELYIRDIPVDIITLKNKLNEKGKFEKVGGMDYIVSISCIVSTSVQTKYYVKIVYEKSVLRKLIKMSAKISTLSYEGKEKVDEIIDFAEKGIFNIIQNRRSNDFFHINEVLVHSIDKIEEINNSNIKITGLETGFSDFDNKTAGLQPSDLILIAARPSMGKSAFALNIAQFVAVKKNVSTAIFSLEMSKEQVANRLLCSQALLDSQKLRTGGLEQEDWSKIAYAIGELSEAPIYIDDTPSITVTELRAKCRKLKIEKELGLIIVDYLQLMNANKRADSRQQEISEISRSLKAVAREMEAPLIALSQLSRACELRSDHRPMLSDLRESGAIEQDADVVCFLYREDYYDKTSEKQNQAEIIIAKQRNGPTGTVELAWLGKYTKFANLSREF